ncbi:MAG TPA: hypothetical protein PL064_00420 [Thermogutta sp.]|nr:hypothetical protein [Thermogutta sp.]HQF14729.1 hypothetical protein [Thermogutta sp.]
MPPIEIVCSNGHRLKVKDEFAGRTGACPICGVKVKVPPKTRPLTEDDVLKFLGDAPPPPTEPEPAAEVRKIVRTDSPARLPKKICEKCHREILAATRICPYSHTYLGFSDIGAGAR